MGDAAGADPAKALKAQADLQTLGPSPVEPLKPNLTFQEPTIERLFKFYQAGRPSVGLFTDEGGSFIGGHGMNTDNRLKTIAGYSSLWNGDKLTRMRAGDGTSDYPGRRLSMHVMVQPIIAHPFLADPLVAGQGFLARFLITDPPSAIGTRLRRGHDSGSRLNLDAFTSRLAQILATPMPTGDTERELAPVTLPLSPRARDLLWRFYEETERAQALGGDLEQIRSYGSKAAEQAARIAGVLTLWTDLDAPEVAPEAMGWGIELARFYLGEARRLAEAGGISEETNRAEMQRRWLVNSWPHDEIIPREVVRFGPTVCEKAKRPRGCWQPSKSTDVQAGSRLAWQSGCVAIRLAAHTQRRCASAVGAQHDQQEVTAMRKRAARRAKADAESVAGMATATLAELAAVLDCKDRLTVGDYHQLDLIRRELAARIN